MAVIKGAAKIAQLGFVPANDADSACVMELAAARRIEIEGFLSVPAGGGEVAFPTQNTSKAMMCPGLAGWFVQCCVEVESV